MKLIEEKTLVLVKPDGVLSVTYEFRGTAASRALDEYSLQCKEHRPNYQE